MTTLPPAELLDFLKHFHGNHLFGCIATESGYTYQLFGSIEEKYKELLEQEQVGWQIFFTVNEPDTSGNRKTENIIRARAVFVDDDTPRTGGPRTDFLLKPSLIVESSEGKYHYYWLTSTDCLTEWCSVMEALVVIHETDPAPKDLPRLLRLPTFKHKSGFVTRVVDDNGKRYSWDEITKAYPPLPEGRKTAPGAPGAPGAPVAPGTPGTLEARTYKDIVDTIVNGVANTDLHASTRDLIWQMTQDGCPRLMIDAIMDGLTAHYDPQNERQRENKGKLKNLINSAFSKKPHEWGDIKDIPLNPKPENPIRFPLEYVPHSLKQAAQAIADYYMTDVDDVLLVMVGIISSCIHRKALIEVGTSDLVVPFSLGILNVADPGMFKSGVLDKSIKGYDEGEGEANKKYKKANASVNADIMFLEREKKSLLRPPSSKDTSDTVNAKSKDTLKKSKRLAEILLEMEELSTLRRPRPLLDDSTQEQAIFNCYEAGGALTYRAAEASSFIANLKDQYGKQQVKADLVVRAMTQDDYIYKRKGDSIEVVMRPVGNITICGQYDIIEEFLNDENINYIGLPARLLINIWKDTKKVKHKDNVKFRVNDCKEYWHVTKKLSEYWPDNSEFVYSLENDPDERLLQPVTKIKTATDPQRYMDMFNSLYPEFEEGGKYAGMQSELNKTLTTAYIVYGCLFAYNKYDVFYSTPTHEVLTSDSNGVEHVFNYIVQKRLEVLKVRHDKAVLNCAHKILNFIQKSTSMSEFKAGIAVSSFNNKLKSHGGNSRDKVEARIYEAALSTLEVANILQFKFIQSDNKFFVFVHPDLERKRK